MEEMFDWARWQRYFADVEEARRWYEYVPDPVSAADWYFVGVRKPAEAAEWIRLKKSPQVLRDWRSAGFVDVSEILGWVRIGQSIERSKRWMEIGFEDSASAGKWALLVEDPESLLEWFRRGVETPEELEALRCQGLTLTHVSGLDVKTEPTEGWVSWTQLTTQGQVSNPEIVNSWLIDRFPLAEAAEWVDVGATPLERDILLSNGVSLEVLKGLKTSRCSEIATNFHSQYQDLSRWFEHGFEFEEMMRWKQAEVSIDEALDWRAIEVPSDRARRLTSLGFTAMDCLENLENPLIHDSNLARWVQAGLPQGSVRMFVLGGIPDPETARKWLDGFGSDPSRAVVQYQKYDGDYRRARVAMRQAERLRINSSRSVTTSPQQLEVEPSSNAISLPPTSPQRLIVAHSSPALRLPPASEEWLDEVVAWAHTLRTRLRKLIQSPSVLALNELGIEIRIEIIDGLIWGRVKTGNRTLSCKFDPDSFDPLTDIGSSEQRFVFGACLCWFIDCSIVIHAQGKGAAALYREVEANTRRASSLIRYVPTPTFSTSRIGRRAGDRLGLRVRHQVSGHIRALSEGRRGSEAARKSAPKHIQRVMKRNETYVQPHFRGTEEQRRELEVRLSRYSAFGEAMSYLNWS